MRNLILAILFASLTMMQTQAQIKVACVGNSITWGAGIEQRENNSYPAQLQEMLGSNYQVLNFGSSGSTLLSNGDRPYIKTQAYAEAIKCEPDIVLIKLGTNDTKPQNRIHLSHFVEDYKALISSFQSLKSKPRVIVLTPLQLFNKDTSYFSQPILKQKITPMIEKAAFEKNVEIIHLGNVISKYQNFVITDSIHPTSIGAGRIASRIYEHLSSNTATVKKSSKLIAGIEPTNFYGFACYNFSMDQIPCKIVLPKRVAKGKPWIWRARFWGVEPQTEIALLERGFHLVYCDVANLFGAPSAVERGNKFYNLMRKEGLAPKVVLEGMSRGGLMVYHWAAENPQKVACIYADAPVLDLKSWPMKCNDRRVIDQMMKAYNFKDSLEVANYRSNPIDQTAIFAKAGFPILHVCGDADTVVPMNENSDVFERHMKELNAPIQVIRKPGVGHHPHSLENPQPIVDFILESTGQRFILTNKAIPGNEYRVGAGWTKGSDWGANHREIAQVIMSNAPLDLLLIGNSITQGFGGDRSLVAYAPGKEPLNEAIPGKKWQSAGISGDHTEHVLYRLKHGNYELGRPKVIVLTIGINNLGSGNSVDDTFLGIKTCIAEIKKRMPHSKLIVYGTLPAGEKPDSPLRISSKAIQERMTEYAKKEKGFVYRNPETLFVNPDGSLKNGYYSSDMLHLLKAGYEAWSRDIATFIP